MILSSKYGRGGGPRREPSQREAVPNFMLLCSLRVYLISKPLQVTASVNHLFCAM